MIERFANENKARIKYAMLGSIFFFLAAHGFAALNLNPQHDALNYMFFFAGNWELVLGRFLLPVYGMIRGSILAPWMIGMITMLFLGATVYLVTDLLKIEKPLYIVLTAGFLAANMTFTELMGVFTYVADAFMVSIFLAVLGVYLVVRIKGIRGMILSAIAFFVSFGIYQAYVTVAMVMFIAVICMEAQEEEKLDKKVWFRWICYAIPAAVGTVCYFAVFKIVFAVTGLAEVQYYDSLSSLSSLDPLATIKAALNYYRYYLYIFLERQCLTGTATKIANLIIFAAAAYLTLRYLVKNKEKMPAHVLMVLGALAFPVCAMLTDILMGGRSITYRTAFAVYLTYPMLLLIFEQQEKELKKWIRTLLLICCGIVLYQNILYSNGAYATQKILYDRALVDVGRILGDIHQDDDFVPGETETVVIGTFEENEYLSDTVLDAHVLDGFEKTAVTYLQTFNSFVHLLGEDISLSEDEELIRKYSTSKEVQNMPSFPAKGYCRMLDGRMVIKLSDEEE